MGKYFRFSTKSNMGLACVSCLLRYKDTWASILDLLQKVIWDWPQFRFSAAIKIHGQVFKIKYKKLYGIGLSFFSPPL